jgi:transcriptional regulator with XRE-family HTH domain
MATTLAPVDSREVLRCDHCGLVQFRGGSNCCRRCRTSLDEEILPEPSTPLPASMRLSEPPQAPHLQLAAQIRRLRVRNGLSQRQLATRMAVPRTYVSKIENEKATPTLASLERLAKALEVTVPDLLCGYRPSDSLPQTAGELENLLQDEFIGELLPYVHHLNSMQMHSITHQLREMATRLKHSA